MLRKHSKTIIALLALWGCLVATNVNAQTKQAWTSSGTEANLQAGTSYSIKVQLKSTSDPTNSPHPQFRVMNVGNTAVDLSTLTLRYWFNCDCQQPATTSLAGFGDWAGMIPSGQDISPFLYGFFEPVSVGKQTHVLVLGFRSGAPMLQPGETVQVHARINKFDWSQMPQANDFSYAAYSNFTIWNRADAYINGVRMWGEEP
jgi:hypothetical protein